MYAGQKRQQAILHWWENFTCLQAIIAESFHQVKFMLYLTNFQFKIIASARLT
jgi:hypothetical protein